MFLISAVYFPAQAELKLVIKPNNDGPRIPIRLLISNDQGYSLNLELYREVPNLATGAVHLVSYGSRIGSLHGALANQTYKTQDFLQLKRFQVTYSFIQLIKFEMVGFIEIHT